MERKSTCANLKADTTGNICVKVFWRCFNVYSIFITSGHYV